MAQGGPYCGPRGTFPEYDLIPSSPMAISFLVSYECRNKSCSYVYVWMAEWLRCWTYVPMCKCTRGFESRSWQTYFF